MAGIRLYRRTGPNSGFSIGLGSLAAGLFLIPCLFLGLGQWLLMDPWRVVLAVVFVGIFGMLARSGKTPENDLERENRKPVWERD